jgi:hypothetical protein
MALAGYYRAQPIDFSKKIYFSFYKQAKFASTAPWRAARG